MVSALGYWGSASCHKTEDGLSPLSGSRFNKINSLEFGTHNSSFGHTSFRNTPAEGGVSSLFLCNHSVHLGKVIANKTPNRILKYYTTYKVSLLGSWWY